MIPASYQMDAHQFPKAIEVYFNEARGVYPNFTRLEITLSEGIEKGIVMPRKYSIACPNQFKWYELLNHQTESIFIPLL